MVTVTVLSDNKEVLDSSQSRELIVAKIQDIRPAQTGAPAGTNATVLYEDRSTGLFRELAVSETAATIKAEANAVAIAT